MPGLCHYLFHVNTILPYDVLELFKSRHFVNYKTLQDGVYSIPPTPAPQKRKPQKTNIQNSCVFFSLNWPIVFLFEDI